MRMLLDTGSVDDYETFLKNKSLPKYRFTGSTAEFPDEYAKVICGKSTRSKPSRYTAPAWMFDYQRDITTTAVTKKRYAAAVRNCERAIERRRTAQADLFTA